MSHIDSLHPNPVPENPTQESKVSLLDKPKTTRPPITDLIPVAVISPDDAMTAEWLEELINDLRAHAGLTPRPHEGGTVASREK